MRYECVMLLPRASTDCVAAVLNAAYAHPSRVGSSNTAQNTVSWVRATCLCRCRGPLPPVPPTRLTLSRQMSRRALDPGPTGSWSPATIHQATQQVLAHASMLSLLANLLHEAIEAGTESMSAHSTLWTAAARQCAATCRCIAFMHD